MPAMSRYIVRKKIIYVCLDFCIEIDIRASNVWLLEGRQARGEVNSIHSVQE